MNEQTIIPGEGAGNAQAELDAIRCQLNTFQGETFQAGGDGYQMYSDEWVNELVSYHTPDASAINRIAAIRGDLAASMKSVIRACPDCGDRDKALEHLRQAMFHANASIILWRRTLHDQRGRPCST